MTGFQVYACSSQHTTQQMLHKNILCNMSVLAVCMPAHRKGSQNITAQLATWHKQKFKSMPLVPKSSFLSIDYICLVIIQIHSKILYLPLNFVDSDLKGKWGLRNKTEHTTEPISLWNYSQMTQLKQGSIYWKQ